jgi:hypothetical protein
MAYGLTCTLDLEGNTEGKIRATEELDKLKEQRAEEQVFDIAEFLIILLLYNNSLQFLGHTFISFLLYHSRQRCYLKLSTKTVLL